MSKKHDKDHTLRSKGGSPQAMKHDSHLQDWTYRKSNISNVSWVLSTREDNFDLHDFITGLPSGLCKSIQGGKQTQS